MNTRECLRNGPESSDPAERMSDLSSARSRAIIRRFRWIDSPEQQRAAQNHLHDDWKKVREELDKEGLRSRRDLDDSDIIGVLNNLPEMDSAQVDVQKLKSLINYAVNAANLISLAPRSPGPHQNSIGATLQR